MSKIAGILLLCAFGGLVASGETWKEVRFTPDRIDLPNSSASQRFVISALDRAGKVSDVTALALVTSSDPSIADAAEGVVQGKAAGRATLTISLGTVSSLAEVTVGSQSARVDVRFSPDVVSILTIKGCNSSGCHGSPAGQNGFKLSLFGYDVNADHEMIAKKQEGRRLNLLKPEDSLFLKKPLFTVPHGGGRLLSP
ncbi:MAG: Ig-like domain-containing protein, partial [Bryobacteraceae bacterium]